MAPVFGGRAIRAPRCVALMFLGFGSGSPHLVIVAYASHGVLVPLLPSRQ